MVSGLSGLSRIAPEMADAAGLLRDACRPGNEYVELGFDVARLVDGGDGPLHSSSGSGGTGSGSRGEDARCALADPAQRNCAAEPTSRSLLLGTPPAMNPVRTAVAPHLPRACRLWQRERPHHPQL